MAARPTAQRCVSRQPTDPSTISGNERIGFSAHSLLARPNVRHVGEQCCVLDRTTLCRPCLVTPSAFRPIAAHCAFPCATASSGALSGYATNRRQNAESSGALTGVIRQPIRSTRLALSHRKPIRSSPRALPPCRPFDKCKSDLAEVKVGTNSNYPIRNPNKHSISTTCVARKSKYRAFHRASRIAPARLLLHRA